MWWLLRLASRRLRRGRGVGRVQPVALSSLTASTPQQLQQLRALRKIQTTTPQLQSKYKHADVFGIRGNPTKATVAQFDTALRTHVASGRTMTVVGTYRRGGSIEVIHHIDPVTRISVMTDRSGRFISVWELSAGQARNVLETGVL